MIPDNQPTRNLISAAGAAGAALGNALEQEQLRAVDLSSNERKVLRALAGGPLAPPAAAESAGLGEQEAVSAASYHFIVCRVIFNCFCKSHISIFQYFYLLFFQIKKIEPDIRISMAQCVKALSI